MHSDQFKPKSYLKLNKKYVFSEGEQFPLRMTKTDGMYKGATTHRPAVCTSTHGRGRLSEERPPAKRLHLLLLLRAYAARSWAPRMVPTGASHRGRTAHRPLLTPQYLHNAVACVIYVIGRQLRPREPQFKRKHVPLVQWPKQGFAHSRNVKGLCEWMIIFWQTELDVGFDVERARMVCRTRMHMFMFGFVIDLFIRLLCQPVSLVCLFFF